MYSVYHIIGIGGLEVACWPLVPKFAGSNPAEAVGFLRAKKSSARLPSEGKYSRLSHVADLRHVKDLQNYVEVEFQTKSVGTFFAHEEFHLPLLEDSRVVGREGTQRRRWERLKAGESNGNLPLRTCPGCSVPGPYWSPDWVLVPAKTGLRAEY